MTPVTVDLDDDLYTWLEEQARATGYPSAHDYIVGLVEKECRSNAAAKLEQLAEEALNSGPSAPFTDADWEHIREQVELRRLQHNKA